MGGQWQPVGETDPAGIPDMFTTLVSSLGEFALVAPSGWTPAGAKAAPATPAATVHAPTPAVAVTEGPLCASSESSRCVASVRCHPSRPDGQWQSEFVASARHRRLADPSCCGRCGRGARPTVDGQAPLRVTRPAEGAAPKVQRRVRGRCFRRSGAGRSGGGSVRIRPGGRLDAGDRTG